MDIRIKVALGLLWSVFMFLAGWRVESWHYSEQQRSQLEAALKEQNANTTLLINVHNKEVEHIDALNAATTQDQVHTQLLIQAQNDAIAKLDTKISSIRVGVCTIAPTANSVLLDAYKAAFPVAPAPKANGGKTIK